MRERNQDLEICLHLSPWNDLLPLSIFYWEPINSFLIFLMLTGSLSLKTEKNDYNLASLSDLIQSFLSEFKATSKGAYWKGHRQTKTQTHKGSDQPMQKSQKCESASVEQLGK